ncbi:helix-turn-helix domain-containing protein [bacterium]|nr:helix-turn-helix domain-containing protein [bacterium]
MVKKEQKDQGLNGSQGNVNALGQKEGFHTKRLLSVEEAASYLGISPRTIYNAVSRKSKRPFPVKPKRIGRLVRFDIRDLETYVESL